MNSLEPKLLQLKLARIRQIYPEWIERAGQTEMDYGEFLDQLLTEELLTRQENQLKRRLRQAGFPFNATLEQFDFSLRPELKRPVIMRFFDSSFVEKAGSLILIGPSGLGKTHLAVSVGTRMVQLGYEVRFITAQRLANQVLASSTRHELEKLLEPLIGCHLLILDELGYLALDERLGPVLYEIIASRYEKRATIVTSNKSLSSWGELIGGGDSALMMALIDRLLHHGEVFYLKGPSYRMRGKEQTALLPTIANSGTVTNLNGKGNGVKAEGVVEENIK
jgi:DNA replication protein DnaC